MAYCSRLQAGQSQLSKILEGRRRVLPRAALEGRTLSQEPYLRPTLCCNSHAPEVFALADELRQGLMNDWEYAQAIYNFVCNKIIYVIAPPPTRGVVETLEKGYGICVDKLNVLAALARAGGIPARFCFVDSRFRAVPEGRGESVLALRWLIEAFGGNANDHLGRRITWRLRQLWALINPASAHSPDRFGWRTHPHVELKIGNFWIPADPTWGDEEAAELGLALPRLGYDPLMLWGLTGNVIERSEELPVRWQDWIARRFFCPSACGTIQCANETLEEARARWRRLLEGPSRDEYIRRMRRFYMPVPGVTELGMPPLL